MGTFLLILLIRRDFRFYQSVILYALCNMMLMHKTWASVVLVWLGKYCEGLRAIPLTSFFMQSTGTKGIMFNNINWYIWNCMRNCRTVKSNAGVIKGAFCGYIVAASVNLTHPPPGSVNSNTKDYNGHCSSSREDTNEITILMQSWKELIGIFIHQNEICCASFRYFLLGGFLTNLKLWSYRLSCGKVQ